MHEGLYLWCFRCGVIRIKCKTPALGVPGNEVFFTELTLRYWVDEVVSRVIVEVTTKTCHLEHKQIEKVLIFFTLEQSYKFSCRLHT